MLNLGEELVVIINKLILIICPTVTYLKTEMCMQELKSVKLLALNLSVDLLSKILVMIIFLFPFLCQEKYNYYELILIQVS